MCGRGSRVSLRVTAACLLLVLGSAAASLAGCSRAGSEPRPAATAWRVDVLKRTLPAVVLVRGRQLCVERLDSPTATPIWTAPAETTPTILAVDQPGGRIAVLLRESTGATSTLNHHGGPSIPAKWRDAGIVVLSANGSARRHAVVTSRSHVGASWSGPGFHRSFEGTVTDLVNSGAFVGPDLVLATDRPSFGYSHAGPPLRLTPGGIKTTLTVDGADTLGYPAQFLQLPSGKAAVVRLQGMAGAVTSNVTELRLTGSRVAIPSIGAVGSADGSLSVSLPHVANGVHSTVIATLQSGGWSVGAPLRIDMLTWGKAHNPSYGPFSYDMGVPGAGPNGGLLVPIVMSPALNVAGAKVRTMLARRSVSATDDEVWSTPVYVDNESDSRSRTWAYLTRFGPAR